MDFLHGDDPNFSVKISVCTHGFAESCVEFEIFCLQVVGETIDSDVCVKF